MSDSIQLLAAIEQNHPEPYRSVAPELLKQQAERAAEVDVSERERGIVELMRLAALLGEGNGHTGILPWREQTIPFELYPIRLYEFEEGMFVVAATAEDLIGCELIAVAGVPLADVIAEVTPLVSRDNEWTVRERRARFVAVAEVLRGASLTTGFSPVGWRVREANGALRNVALEPLPNPDWERLLLQGRPARSIEALDGGRTLHVEYNVTRGETAGFADEIQRRAGKSKALVLDLRHNAGGDSTTYGPLLSTLEELTSAGKHLAVLTSRATFSAAMHLVIDLEQRTPAIFIGEPTGASPNHYGDPVTVELPDTRVTARVATISWKTAGEDDQRQTREPDILIPCSASAFFAGEDPVLAAALERIDAI
jgi:hypothetical protein